MHYVRNNETMFAPIYPFKFKQDYVLSIWTLMYVIYIQRNEDYPNLPITEFLFKKNHAKL